MHSDDGERPGPLDDGPGDPRSGFVVVRLQPDLPPGSAATLRAHAEDLGLAALAALLERLGDPPATRLVQVLEPERLLALERRAAGSPWPPLHSLTQYWRIDARLLDIAPEALAERVRRLPAVDHAYAEAVTWPAGVHADDDPLSPLQGYLDPAPAGIDARWAWSRPGGDGAGIGFVDVEEGWWLGHEAVARWGLAGPLAGDNRNLADRRDHGVAVLGVVAGADDAAGTVGIAPNVRSAQVSSVYRAATDDANRIADALVAAVAAGQPGDVVVVEMQKGNPPLPVEAEPDVLDAIRLASALGLVVVEAAGNGWQSLDARLGAAHPPSGAIVVGAAAPALSTWTPAGATAQVAGHGRISESNHGARVDCYAWGRGVATAGYGDLTPGADPARTYTGAFSRTSAATAIVAGAAVLTQAMYRAATGTLLSPGQLRAVLADPANGTPHVPAGARTIGHMPDLRRVAAALGLVPDVYLRDAVGDTGAAPGTGPTGQSPDVIVRADPVADPVAAFGEGSGTADDPALSTGPVAGRDNTVHVRVRNRGGTAATDVRALVYTTPVSTLQTPATWTVVGYTGPFTVPPGDALTVAPAITWAAADVPADGPRGLVVLLDHPADPAPPLPADLSWDEFVAVVRDGDNITFRNFHLVAPADPLVLDFLLAGAPDRDAEFDLEIGVRLPAGARLHLDLPPVAVSALPSGWRERTGPPGDDRHSRLELPLLRTTSLRGMRLHAGAAHRCRLHVTAPDGLGAGHGLGVAQFHAGIRVGGISWAVRPR